jgi:hypothetical protein
MAKPLVSDPVFESSGIVWMARITDVDDAVLTQAKVDSISLTVRDKEAPGVDIAASPYTLDKADVIYDTLQTGGAWKKDDTGYNFKYNTLAAQIPDGDKIYRFELTITPVSGEVIKAWLEVPTLNAFVD